MKSLLQQILKLLSESIFCCKVNGVLALKRVNWRPSTSVQAPCLLEPRWVINKTPDDVIPYIASESHQLSNYNINLQDHKITNHIIPVRSRPRKLWRSGEIFWLYKQNGIRYSLRNASCSERASALDWRCIRPPGSSEFPWASQHSSPGYIWLILCLTGRTDRRISEVSTPICFTAVCERFFRGLQI